MKIRHCPKCKKTKELKDFHKNKNRLNGHDCYCKECKKKLNYSQYNSQEKREYSLKRRYNITLEEYNQLFIGQGGKCSICNRHQEEFSTALCVDHCHKTKKIRGLLCSKCNRTIGLMEDNILWLKNAAGYLELNK